MLSSVEKLQKFIKLEIERGYDNRAVVGGLDKILPSWENEARSNQVSEELIQTVLTSLRTYPTLDAAQRAEELTRLLGQLEQMPAGAPISGAEPVSAEMEIPRMAVSGALPERLPRNEMRSQQPKRPRPTPGAAGPSAHSSSPRVTTTDLNGLKAPVRVLQGVGGRLSETLGSIGLNTLEDLLYYFPRRYDDYSQLKPINRLTFGEETTLLATIQSIFSRPIRGGKMHMTEAVVTDGTGSLRVNWFNQPWLADKFTTGAQVVLSGKIDQYMGRLTMSNPEIEPIEADHLHTNRIVPVYSLTARLNQKNLRRLMFQTVTYWGPRVPDYVPDSVRRSAKLMDLSTALLNIHFPESQDMLSAAQWRLAFDEIFLLQLGVLRQKRSWQSAAGQVFETPQDWVDTMIAQLPFPLTGAQKRVIQEIRADLASGRPMDRLVQGDVGSGKTVVAALAIAMITRQGAQATVMAPTSILAEQHYRTLTRLLTAPQGAPEEEAALAPLKPEEICLLVGDTSEAEKQAIREGLADGRIKVAIGTHALIEDPVQFQRLQLAVIDEQHRFGVSQRSALRLKGDNPHLLVMTATPIPRSLALTVYGDLDLSVMDEMPVGRQPISTYVLRPVERERAYNMIRAQVNQGHQAFIIYPRVEIGDLPEDEVGSESEDAPRVERPSAEQATALAAVEAHQHLQAEIFKNLKVGLLHGRMKPEEKDQVMKDFRDHQYDILVSTTVVEVGVDVPNATVMLIEGANRFGLAQLHQLRGRVGRGSVQSYCLLIPDQEDAIENERLAVMAETNDGFVLAERDLQQRGPGDFLGTRQAGFSELKMAKLTDVRLIEQARLQAQNVFQKDPELSAPEHQMLSMKLQAFWSDGRGDVS
jgi:ATP-dependent DNA helicase RecG